ncbi:MAG TPA: hypothetical protein VMZ53_16175 [Kofleriaceae bacterium]|nr:hypothetical protein [Kofleriaceae bacterium]
MKQGRGPGAKKDDKDVPQPAVAPAQGKKTLVEAATPTKPATPTTANVAPATPNLTPTTANPTSTSTKKRADDDWQPNWRRLKSFAKRARVGDEDKTDEDAQAEAAAEKAAADAQKTAAEAKAAADADRTAADGDVTHDEDSKPESDLLETTNKRDD